MTSCQVGGRRQTVLVRLYIMWVVCVKRRRRTEVWCCRMRCCPPTPCTGTWGGCSLHLRGAHQGVVGPCCTVDPARVCRLGFVSEQHNTDSFASSTCAFGGHKRRTIHAGLPIGSLSWAVLGAQGMMTRFLRADRCASLAPGWVGDLAHGFRGVTRYGLQLRPECTVFSWAMSVLQKVLQVGGAGFFARPARRLRLVCRLLELGCQPAI